MIGKIIPYSDRYVEYVSKIGLPHVLKNFQGEVVGKDTYYPSPAMHQQLSEILYPVCKIILEKTENS